MERYDYLEAVKNDVRNYIENKIDIHKFSNRLELEMYLNDYLFVNDSVTGNASGSYTFNIWEAEECLCHNIDLLTEALNTYSTNVEYALTQGAEFCDVVIRCYVLAQAITEVLNEMEVFV